MTLTARYYMVSIRERACHWRWTDLGELLRIELSASASVRSMSARVAAGFHPRSDAIRAAMAARASSAKRPR